MKLIIISTIEYPSALANRVHLLEMTRAFAPYFSNVILLCRSVTEAAFPKNVSVTSLARKRSLTSAWSFARFLKKNPQDVWFAREPHLLLFTVLTYIFITWKLPPKIWYEIHDMPRDRLDGMTIRLLKFILNVHIITITNALKVDLQSQFRLKDESVVVLPDGVDLERFMSLQEQSVASRELKVVTNKFVVGYIGSLYEWKGVYTLLDAAKRTPEVEYWFIGGREEDIKSFKKAAEGMENVRIWGHVLHAEVHKYMAAADVLALPNSATYKMSLSYTSPLKLFEYMATGRPVVASDLPSIREIVTDKQNAFLVTPDDSEALASKITEVLTLDISGVVAQAKSDVQQYSWKRRVERIIESL